MGCGLSGVQRLMDEFAIDSGPGRGTRVVARKWLRRR
jgi:serine/threonine-protein kinase RsbT